ncbi:hypothetical protein PTKIN_Ptkin10aG0186200 [Pterospermum kingtungense]
MESMGSILKLVLTLNQLQPYAWSAGATIYVAPIGDYAVDGCGKFVRCVGQDETKVETIVCAVCGCHRSFHRKVVMTLCKLRNSSMSPNEGEEKDNGDEEVNKPFEINKAG